MEIVSLAEELKWPDYLPLEIRYIIAQYPKYEKRIKAILEAGKAIGIRTILRTNEDVLKAINAISVYSQHNYIVTWLPKLLKDKHLPIFSPEDYKRAKQHGEDLDKAVDLLVHDRLRFKRLVLIDEENIGIDPREQKFMTELSELIYPLCVNYAVYRVVADNARERTHIAQTILKALLFIGPIAHVLEKFMSGIGKVFAASTDDLIGETAEIMALRGSGFGWRELAKRGRILVPVFALATYGAFQVEPLIQEGKLIAAGIVFGLSAVALSLVTAIQSFFMYRKNLRRLQQENKASFVTRKELNRITFVQDFTNPARLGLIMGASMAPVMGIIGSLAGVMHNGWALAVIGSTESIVAGLTVIGSGPLNEWRFQRKLKKTAQLR
jgi:hypothetical protein